MKIRHRLTATILLIAFATTSALPAAGIPNVKTLVPIKAVPAVPPRVVTPPKVPVLAVPKVPSVPKVPVVKTPVTPKLPNAPRVPVVKVPVVPKVSALVKVPSIKIPATKTPVTPRIVKAPAIKAPVIVSSPKAPITVKALVRPVIVKAQVAAKPSPVNPASKQSKTPAPVTSAPPNGKQATTMNETAFTPVVEKEISPERAQRIKESLFHNAYERQQQAEEAERDPSGETKDPYRQNGGFDSELFKRDELIVNNALVEQVTGDPPPNPSSPDDIRNATPVVVTNGQVSNIGKILEAAETSGVDKNDPAVRRALEEARTKRHIDIPEMKRLRNEIANVGVDEAFGPPPALTVEGLIQEAERRSRMGDHRGAADIYDQAADAFKHGGRNSAEYRLGIIAEVDLGLRPPSDRGRVVADPSDPPPGTSSPGGQGGSPSPTGDRPSSPDSPRQPGGSDFALPDRNDRSDKNRQQETGNTGTSTGATTPAAPAGEGNGGKKRESSTVIDFGDYEPSSDPPKSEGYVPAEPAEEFYEPDGERTNDDPPPDSDDEDILAPATDSEADDSKDADDTTETSAGRPAPDGESRRRAEDAASDPTFWSRVSALFGKKAGGGPNTTNPVRGDTENPVSDRNMPVINKKPGLLGNPTGANARPATAVAPDSLRPAGNTHGNTNPDRNDTPPASGPTQGGAPAPKPGGGV